MARRRRIREHQRRVYLSHAWDEPSKLAAEHILRSVSEVWASQPSAKIASKDFLLRWEAGTQEFSDFWRKSLVATLRDQDTASNRGRLAVDDMVADGLTDATTAERARTLIEALFTPNTVYASIAPDDGGITFYWRAADMSIEIDIYPIEGYWWRVRNVAMENYSGHGKELPIPELKHSLTWLSKEVDRVNPHWRAQPI